MLLLFTLILDMNFKKVGSKGIGVN